MRSRPHRSMQSSTGIAQPPPPSRWRGSALATAALTMGWLLQWFLQDRGKRKYRNALVQQLQGFLQSGLATNGALIGVARMDFAGLFGEARTHIFGLRHHTTGMLQPSGELLRMGGGGLGLPHRERLRRRLRWRRPQVQAWGTKAFVHLRITAQRALHQASLKLRLKIVLRCKPAFKDVFATALQIKHLHGDELARGSGN